MRSNLASVIWFVAVIVVGVLLFAHAVDDDDGATAAVRNMGWTDIEITDRGPAVTGLEGCSRSDGAYFNVRGKDAQGRPAKALVCCGMLFKACTSRAEP